MAKQYVIDTIAEAKKAHQLWVNYARALIDKIPVTKEQIPIDTHICQFGQWLYKNKKHLEYTGFFDELEKQHNEIHELYHKIYCLFFNKEKFENPEKVIGQEIIVSMDTLKEVHFLFQELKHKSYLLISSLNKLEEIVIHLSDDAIEILEK